VGGDGVQVVGRLAPLDHKEKVLWNFALVNAQVQLAPVKQLPIPPAIQNDAKQRQAWWNEFRNTEEGKVWSGILEANERLRKTSPYFTATVDRDGSFRIDDVPQGSYTLEVWFS
jgi:hypothetical protein